MIARDLLSRLGIGESNSGACGREWLPASGPDIASHNPDDWSVVADVRSATRADYDRIVCESASVFQRWRNTPAPVRGEIVREIGDELRTRKHDIGALVTLETGKILAEGEGEVQEMIDIAVFAAGLSRQLHGKTMHSERPGHRMYEQWHPLGPVGVITAFNFPVAVWSWNALIAAVCGDTVVWKPSPRTPLSAIAVQRIANDVASRHGFAGVFSMVVGSNEEIGETMLRDRRLPLISFTGSSAVGRHAASVIGERLGRALLELGGNNGLIVMNDADPDLALRAVLFGAVGTAGQRCTTTRRLFLQRGISSGFLEKLKTAYKHVRVGNPMEPETMMGPLISPAAVDRMMQALDIIRRQGGTVEYGGSHLGGCFVEPTIVRARHDLPIMRDEIFAPILYVIEFDDIDQVIAWHNAVPQGLSSAIFTRHLADAETFLSHSGSDCGIANVNVGTSGAEIGGAFGGEKDTGGGREAGSDSWKAYMRRQTVTINWSKDLPLAQGIPGIDISI